jgi:hypothetical protein
MMTLSSSLSPAFTRSVASISWPSRKIKSPYLEQQKPEFPEETRRYCGDVVVVSECRDSDAEVGFSFGLRLHQWLSRTLTFTSTRTRTRTRVTRDTEIDREIERDEDVAGKPTLSRTPHLINFGWCLWTSAHSANPSAKLQRLKHKHT